MKKITKKMQQEGQFKGMDFKEIRNKLEMMGYDRHMPIELDSTEIALITPMGVLMQIRPSDHDQLGMWGGVIKSTETPVEGAQRELLEETGLNIPQEKFHFIEEHLHTHQYANGDLAEFHCYRYTVILDYIPQITTDNESVGAFMVVHTIIDHQQDFIKRVLKEK